MKGQSGNPSGRAKGVPNKVTINLKKLYGSILEENAEQLRKDFKSLSAKDKWMIAEKISQYVSPKMQSIDSEINLDKLSEEQLNEVINNFLDTAVEE